MSMAQPGAPCYLFLWWMLELLHVPNTYPVCLISCVVKHALLHHFEFFRSTFIISMPHPPNYNLSSFCWFSTFLSYFSMSLWLLCFCPLSLKCVLISHLCWMPNELLLVEFFASLSELWNNILLTFGSLAWCLLLSVIDGFADFLLLLYHLSLLHTCAYNLLPSCISSSIILHTF